MLFDIDGTILLASGAGRRAITTALGEAVGTVAAFEQVRFDGKTDPQIVEELLAASGHQTPPTAAAVEALCRRYVALLEEELRRKETVTTLMPGIEALLDRLAADDAVVLGLLTGNVVRGAELKLQAAGIDPARFVVGAYGSDATRRHELPPIAARRAEPHFGRVPAGADVVIVGDTPADVACGAGIEARAVAVATGSYSVEELTACRPHAVFVDLADTERVLAAILD